MAPFVNKYVASDADMPVLLQRRKIRWVRFPNRPEGLLRGLKFVYAAQGFMILFLNMKSGITLEERSYYEKNIRQEN